MAVSTSAEAERRSAARVAASRDYAQAFAPTDWGLVAVVALLWGASFLFIELGLEHLAPPVVAFLRVLFGAASLGAA